MSKSRAKNKQRRRARGAADRSATGARERARTTPREPAQRHPSRLEVREGVPRPDAIWAPFPLTEIGMVVGIALCALGFFSAAPTVFVAGVGVLVVVVAELCLREHFAGFRSHSILLGLLPVTIVHLAIVYAGGTSWRGPPALAVDLALAGALAWWLQRRFVHARARRRLPAR